MLEGVYVIMVQCYTESSEWILYELNVLTVIHTVNISRMSWSDQKHKKGNSIIFRIIVTDEEYCTN